MRKQPYTRKFFEDHIKDHDFTSCICEVEIREGILINKNTILEKSNVELLLSRLKEIIHFDSTQAEEASTNLKHFSRISNLQILNLSLD